MPPVLSSSSRGAVPLQLGQLGGGCSQLSVSVFLSDSVPVIGAAVLFAVLCCLLCVRDWGRSVLCSVLSVVRWGLMA